MKIKNTLIPLSVVLAAVCNLLLITLFARQLPAENYAHIVNIKTILLIFSSLLSLGLSQSYIFYFPKYNTNLLIENQQLRIILFLSVVASFIAICWFLIVGFSLPQKNIFYLVMFPLFGMIMLNNELINFLRASQKFIEVACFIIVRSIILIICSQVWLLLLNSTLSYPLGFLTAETILFIGLISRRNTTKGESKFPRLYFQYGITHAIIISITFAYNFADRLIMSISNNNLIRMTEYDLATVIPLSIFGILGRIFNIFLFPVLSEYKNKSDYLFSIFQKYASVYIIISTLLVFILIELSPVFTVYLFKIDISIWKDYLIHSLLAYHFLGVGAIIATIMYVIGSTKLYLLVLLLSFLIYIGSVVFSTFLYGEVNIYNIPWFLLMSTIFGTLSLTLINWKRVGIFNIGLIYLPMTLMGLKA
jgi:O-antigen/teichoic acid export membrane protein